MIKKFRDFESARKFVHSLGLKSRTNWEEYCKSPHKPNDIPSNPNQVYKKQWKGMGDWLGTGRIANFDKQFRDFESARRFVHSLGLKSVTEWRDFSKSNKKPLDIPAGPGRTYKNKGWKGYGDWLGTGRIATLNMQFRDFESARKFVHSLGLKSATEWNVYAKSPHKPADIPTHPDQSYKKQWKGYGDWLGTGRIATFNMQYRDFESARKFVHSLGLSNNTQWRDFSKSNKKPLDIPAGPDRTYKNKGWIGYGDWLGTGRIATFNMQFRDFESARKFVHSLGLKSQTEWSVYAKSPHKPADIPSNPQNTYKKQWKGMGDWLGTGNVHTKQFRDFESARNFVHSLGLKSETEWRKYIKSGTKPNDIPSHPQNTYKKQWKGMGDWLGTGNVHTKQFRDFESARKFVHSLGLKSQTEWSVYAKSPHKPADIPSNPNQVYKNQWKGMGDWLGTGRIATFNMQYRDFESARKFVQSLGLKSETEWKDFSKSNKKPLDIPAGPGRTYKNKGWKGMGDWLGTGRIANFDKQFRDFESARRFVRSLGLKSQTEWKKYIKSGTKPNDIPSAPQNTYKKQWKGVGDWLGTGRIATINMQYRDFESARKFVHSLGLKSVTEWSVYAKSPHKPADIPSAPNQIYKKHWKGWGDWLGTGNVRTKQFRDFESARKFVHSLGLKSATEWNVYAKSDLKPNDIPYSPDQSYKKQWKGMGDWLGTGRIANFDKQFRDFESARNFVHSLGLKSQTEWYVYAKSPHKPNDIPYAPRNTYKKQWKGWGDWLGTGYVRTTKQFRDFESARKFVHSLGLKSATEWNVYAKSDLKPDDIPSAPVRVYKKHWTGWGDWLGTGNVRTQEIYKNYLPFKEAREQVRALAKKYNLKNWKDYKNAVKKGLIPKNIPANPRYVYSKKRKRNGKAIP